MTRKKPKKTKLSLVSLGGIVKEDLPIPYVHYPNHYIYLLCKFRHIICGYYLHDQL